MVSAIWVGNDDYAPTNRMTGGSLPGMIWQQIMAYAHQGIEIKPYPGVTPFQGPRPQPVAATDATHAADYVPPPNLLTRKGADILVRIERMMEDAHARRARRAAARARPRSSSAARNSAERAASVREPDRSVARQLTAVP